MSIEQKTIDRLVREEVLICEDPGFYALNLPFVAEIIKPFYETRVPVVYTYVKKEVDSVWIDDDGEPRFEALENRPEFKTYSTQKGYYNYIVRLRDNFMKRYLKALQEETIKAIDAL